MRQLTSLINQDILARSMQSMSSPRSPLANYVKRDTRTNQRVVTTGTGNTIATQYISNSEPGKVFVVSDGNFIDQRPA
jgi:hypothetical protein